MNDGNDRAAIAEYEKAWDVLLTPWQRQVAGADILEAIADYAVCSQDQELTGETLQTLLPRLADIDHPPLHAAVAKLSSLAAAPPSGLIARPLRRRVRNVDFHLQDRICP